MKEFYYLKIKFERYVQYIIFTIAVQTYVHGHKYRSTANFLVREDKIFQHLSCVCTRYFFTCNKNCTTNKLRKFL